MEGAVVGLRSADWAEGAPINGLVRRGRGRGRRLPKTYAAAARRLPRRLQPTIPHLTRSSLHRCLQRHGILRLPQVEGEASPKRKFFKTYPIGFFHVDIAEVQTAQGKLYLLSRDRPRLQVRGRSARRQGQYADRARLLGGPCRRRALRDRAHRQRHPIRRPAKEPIRPNRQSAAILSIAPVGNTGIEHRLTKPNHPWTNGQVERMNRTIKDATVKRYHYEFHDQLVRHLADFVAAYNFARRLKTLNGLTAYEFVCKRWTTEPERFQTEPAPANAGTKQAVVPAADFERRRWGQGAGAGWGNSRIYRHFIAQSRSLGYSPR